VRSLSAALAIVVVAAVGWAGCQSSAPGGRTASGPAPALNDRAASAAGLSGQEVTDAAQLYVAKCAKCHKFYHPAEYSQKDWEMWMRKMSRKSKLKPPQEELLTRYLGAFREKQQ
jgi:hypothetical protein